MDAVNDRKIICSPDLTSLVGFLHPSSRENAISALSDDGRLAILIANEWLTVQANFKVLARFIWAEARKTTIYP